MDNENQLTASNQETNTLAQVASNKAMSEVQAAILLARKFPRNLNQVDLKVAQACERVKMAEKAMYAYPKGGTMVTGPTIRLAECIARAYGNLDFGIQELDQVDGKSIVQVYCWDFESNLRQTKTFTVKHEMKAKGKIKKLTDPRDVYEIVANQGARRLRACILGILPADIIEDAIEACDKTLKSNNGGKPIADRIKAMVKAFNTLGVSPEMLTERLGHNLDATVETELLELLKIHNSLKDGMSKRQDWFKFKDVKADQSVADKINKQIESKTQDKPKTEETTEKVQKTEKPKNFAPSSK